MVTTRGGVRNGIIKRDNNSVTGLAALRNWRRCGTGGVAVCTVAFFTMNAVRLHASHWSAAK